MSMSQKEMVEVLKIQWKKLWQDRAEDRLRAEGIATADYCDLFIDKGTVIHATRDFKTLSFKEILGKHQFANVDRVISPDPQIGGWSKFIKMNIQNQHSRKKSRVDFVSKKSKGGKNQPKKCGRGWLHR